MEKVRKMNIWTLVFILFVAKTQGQRGAGRVPDKAQIAANDTERIARREHALITPVDML